MESEDENTQTLKQRAQNLINPQFRDFDIDFPKENVTPRHRAIANNIKNSYLSKCESVKDARKKIREEWDALKNSTLINKISPIENANNPRTLKENQILYGTVIYIEVPSKNRMTILKSKLQDLGATVKNTFTQEVTHVVYKNGSLETYKRAKLFNVHLVSVLWIQACENSKTRICEKLFPAFEKKDQTISPKVFRKFWTYQGKNFQYDETTGIIQRKPQDACQSIISSMNNLEINLETFNPNINENYDKTDESESEHTTGPNSPSEYIKLQLSSGEKNQPERENAKVPNTESENVDQNTSKNMKTISKRKLFEKNRESFIQCSNDSVSQDENSYINIASIHGPNAVPPQTFSPTKLLPRVGFKNSQHGNKLPTLVTSYFHAEENNTIKEIIKKLGGFNFKLRVDKTTTHVVVGECQRTSNILKGMARGCWILNRHWIFESANAGYWLSEEYFELIEFSKIVQRCRIQKQSFGKYFSYDIFDECGLIYVSRQCNTHYKDLKELVILSGGKLTRSVENAEIIIGYIEDTTKQCVSSEWVFDSITFGRCKTINSKYILTSS